MRISSVYIDEKLVELARREGINISKEFQTYLAKRVGAYQDGTSEESLEAEKKKAQAKVDAIHNQIQFLKSEKKKKKPEELVEESWSKQ